MNHKPFRHSLGVALTIAALCALALSASWPTRGVSQSAAAAPEKPLPTRVVIDVDSPETELYRIAVPNLLGDSTLGAQGAEVIRNDLRLVSLFNVLDPKSFIANLPQEGLGITKPPWSSVGAQGVVKGQLSKSGGSVVCEMRLFELARGEQPLLTKTYRGNQSQLRGFMHDFANEILRVLTGKPGAFNTRVTFTRKIGPGRKDVYAADFDGQNQVRASGGKGIAMLSAFGALAGIWYSVLTNSGMHITNTKNRGAPVIGGSGLNMGVSICGGRAFFSSSRDGNSEIYSANLDGGDLRRLTNNSAIDISPACGPGGQIAFVSSRHGGPQVFVMGSGGGEAKRITYKGDHNQTPAWCTDPENPMIAFTGRGGGDYDIFTVHLKTGQYTRLTQGQGSNQDPAFSPDCRMVAFASSRGGMFISSPAGLNQTKVISGGVSNIRWGGFIKSR